jgi:hypothetical protein
MDRALLTPMESTNDDYMVIKHDGVSAYYVHVASLFSLLNTSTMALTWVPCVATTTM